MRKCRELYGEDIKKFFDNNFLIDKKELKTKCSNYDELQAYIRKREDDYLQFKVSAEGVNEFSFKFQESIPGFEEEEECVVCLGDYKKDQ